jgi:copper resistance protein B
MFKKLLLTLLTFICVPGAYAITEDDPLLFKVMVDQLEWRDVDEGSLWAWNADARLGKDLNKLWFKTEGEHVDSTTESGFAELFYSRAVATYWDFQAGWRHDFEPEPRRDWFAIGFKGLSPYFFETDATLSAGGNGAIAGRIDTEYEILFTQRLILTPELELDFYSKDDTARGIGSGFSTLELGLRLRYEFRRQFGPYIGISWEKRLGSTADIAKEEGESTSDLQAVLGIRAWF